MKREQGDLDLFEGWRRGDAAAGSSLFARYFDRIYVFFETKAPREAEDLTQRTFEACIESRDRFRGSATFRSYLFGIARLQLLRYFQRRLPRERQLDPAGDSILDLDGSPSQQVSHRERCDLVADALEAIPVDFRIVIELYYWYDLTVPEIANSLGVPPGTVKSRLSRARRALRRALVRLRVSPDLVETTMTRFPPL